MPPAGWCRWPPRRRTPALVVAARAGLQRIYKSGPAYAKAGVILLELSHATRRQSDLFSQSAQRARRQPLMATLDQINQRFGRGSLALANARPAPHWRGREQWRSPRYTTRLDELPVAYC